MKLGPPEPPQNRPPKKAQNQGLVPPCQYKESPARNFVEHQIPRGPSLDPLLLFRLEAGRLKLQGEAEKVSCVECRTTTCGNPGNHCSRGSLSKRFGERGLVLGAGLCSLGALERRGDRSGLSEEVPESLPSLRQRLQPELRGLIHHNQFEMAHPHKETRQPDGIPDPDEH